MSTAAVPHHAGSWLHAGTADTMHAHNQPETLPVCLSFLDGLGLDTDQASALCGQFTVPSLDAERLTPHLLSLVASAGARAHDCLYLSTPITTGRHHLRSPRDSDRDEIITGNRQRARAVVEHLRATRPEMVIDPTGLDDVPGWQQDDYHRLWVAVIERFARIVVFVNDWQYSVGCTKEFGAAYRHALPIFGQDLRPLTYEEGLRLLYAAAREVNAVTGVDTPLLKAIAEVDELVATRPPPDAKP